ncbi:MAG: toprim domain-containing protein [Pseudomonadota bacterium]
MINWSEFEPGDHRVGCPACGRGPKDKTLGITVAHDGAGVAHCFRCNYTESQRPGADNRYRPGVAPARAVAPLKRERLSEVGIALFDACVGLSGTEGESYLTARGCALPPADGDLRLHPALRHHSGYVGPALVALVTDAVTRKPMSLHRTWIKANGEKADIEPARMLLGGHRKAGGVIRLWPDDAVTYGLGVGEGIETALTLARVLKPVWSLIDAGNLATFPVLPGVEVLTIAADHDDAGIKAAEGCATRWVRAGADVRIVRPPKRGQDLNDFVRAAAA